MSQRTTSFQRSRNGCLTCRKKRKKCDEKRPHCLRCERTDSHCTWEILPTTGLDSNNNSPPDLQRDIDDLFLALPHLPGVDPMIAAAFISDLTSRSPSFRNIPFSHATLVGGSDRSWSKAQKHTTQNDLAEFELQFSDSTASSASPPAHSIPTPPSDIDTEPSATRNPPSSVVRWEYAQDYAPLVVWPPVDSANYGKFDPEGIMPTVQQSIAALKIPGDPIFQEIHNFFASFLPRYIYDYSVASNILMARVWRRLHASDSLKHGMLSLAILFRSHYERSTLTPSLRNHAKELRLLAISNLERELQDSHIPVWVKLASLMELVNHEYYTSNLVAYYRHLSQAASIARRIMGGRAIDLLNLGGEATFDVRCFAWCDILSSMALSRPTLLEYQSEIPDSWQPNTTGQEFIDPDKGIEWIFGCPDILAVLLARTTTLRHTHISVEEKNFSGRKIERLIRQWEFRPVRAKQSMLRVARLGAQEIWRHAAILYLHQAIFKSDSGNPEVKNSVKSIIKLASTLSPGINPDCFLPVPYFIAGFFATSESDRYFLRGRVLSCGNERLLRDLAVSLEDLWREKDATGTLMDWSRKQSPSFIF